MVAAHTIFNAPHKVDLKYETIATPKHYRNWYDGRSMHEKIAVWRVHGELKQKDYGLVADGYGFGDSPDCEAISGGINSKGPSSVALGRQGNWFLWGFCAPPSEMTPDAWRVFQNVVVYMKGFEGRTPLVKKSTRSRMWAFVTAGYLSRSKQLQDYALKQFSEELIKASEGNGEKLIALLEKNKAHLRQHDGKWIVDGECRDIGIANYDSALLERCVADLEQGRDTARALRLLVRYTNRNHADAASWRRWLDAARGRLFFSEAGGFRFHVAPKPLARVTGAGGGN